MSAVGACAYRSGEVLKNEYDGITHDFTRKRGIVHTEILLPPHAPPDFADRSTLWNSVEKIEKSKNSQLAREIEVALPIELDREQQIQLVRDYVQKNFVSVGMCADIAIHDKKTGNPHAHIMLTMRPLEQSGEWGAKSKKEYILDKNGQRIALKNGSFKSRKIDTVDWNSKNNYRVKVLNTINFKKSMHYNPLVYIRSEKDILKLVNTIILNTKGEGQQSGEDFWVKAEKLYYTALIGYIWYECVEEEQNFTTLLDMINVSEAREDDEEFKNPVDLMFDELEEREPEHFAVKQYKKYKLAAGVIKYKRLLNQNKYKTATA